MLGPVGASPREPPAPGPGRDRRPRCASRSARHRMPGPGRCGRPPPARSGIRDGRRPSSRRRGRVRARPGPGTTPASRPGQPRPRPRRPPPPPARTGVAPGSLPAPGPTAARPTRRRAPGRPAAPAAAARPSRGRRSRAAPAGRQPEWPPGWRCPPRRPPRRRPVRPAAVPPLRPGWPGSGGGRRSARVPRPAPARRRQAAVGPGRADTGIPGQPGADRCRRRRDGHRHRAARVLGRELSELPLPAQQPQRVGQARLQARGRIAGDRLWLQAGPAGWLQGKDGPDAGRQGGLAEAVGRRHGPVSVMGRSP